MVIVEKLAPMNSYDVNVKYQKTIEYGNFPLYLQELEIVIGDEHISFTTSKIGSLVDVNQSK